MECLRENTVGAFVEARLSPQALAAAEVHLRTCAECHELVASALGAAHGTPPTWRLGPGSPPPTRTAVSNEPARASGVLPPGTSVERFTVLGLVGRGGMGEVYAAYDPSLDRRVALKMVHGLTVAPDAHAHARMLREAQAIAKLSHPNVVVVYEVGTFEQKVFIAMEFVEGRTLAEWLADGGHSWREIVSVFVQAAQGLSAAHRAGFVHRDFKPQNVMVTSEGHVRVMDFGLARRIDSVAANDVSASPASSSSPLDAAEGTLTRTGEQLGTPLYMAPEQFASERVDARTDQFSFCVALFWALYGVHPFGAGQTSATSPPKTTNPPAWLRAVVRRGLRAARKIAGRRWTSWQPRWRVIQRGAQGASSWAPSRRLSSPRRDHRLRHCNSPPRHLPERTHPNGRRLGAGRERATRRIASPERSRRDPRVRRRWRREGLGPRVDPARSPRDEVAGELPRGLRGDARPWGAIATPRDLLYRAGRSHWSYD